MTLIQITTKRPPTHIVNRLQTGTSVALEIDVEEVFLHCAKAFLRSDAWAPSTWNPTAVPSVAQIAKAIRYDWTQAELDARYSEANMRKVLY